MMSENVVNKQILYKMLYLMGGQRIFINIIANIILKIKRQIKGKSLKWRANVGQTSCLNMYSK